MVFGPAGIWYYLLREAPSVYLQAHIRHYNSRSHIHWIAGKRKSEKGIHKQNRILIHRIFPTKLQFFVGQSKKYTRKIEFCRKQ
jgi:hypothetical protein